jgi:transposase-like protein
MKIKEKRRIYTTKAIIKNGPNKGKVAFITNYICRHCEKHFTEMDIIMSCLVIHGPDEYCAVCPHCNQYNEGKRNEEHKIEELEE